MIRRLLIASLASLSLGGCISYPGDGYYTSPRDSYSEYGDDDGYYGSPGYYGDYSYGNVPRISISISFGSGYPYYGYYPSYYGYSHCSPWSAYCYGGRYPNYGYGWNGYWPVYGYNDHHHHPRHNPKPPRHHPENPDRPDQHVDGPDRPIYNADGPDRPGHNTDYPIGVRPDGQRPRAGQRPVRSVPERGDTQPIADGSSPGTQPVPPKQRPRQMPLPIVIDDGREPEFRRADRIPPQKPIRQPVQERPIAVEAEDGEYVRIPTRVRAPRAQQPQAPRSSAGRPEAESGDYVRIIRQPNRNVPLAQAQGQPDRPVNSRGTQVTLQQAERPRAEPRQRSAESAPRESKAKAVRADDDEP